MLFCQFVLPIGNSFAPDSDKDIVLGYGRNVYSNFMMHVDGFHFLNLCTYEYILVCTKEMRRPFV